MLVDLEAERQQSEGIRCTYASHRECNEQTKGVNDAPSPAAPGCLLPAIALHSQRSRGDSDLSAHHPPSDQRGAMAFVSGYRGRPTGDEFDGAGAGCFLTAALCTSAPFYCAAASRLRCDYRRCGCAANRSKRGCCDWKLAIRAQVREIERYFF